MDIPELELAVTMLNINAGYNRELHEQCKALKDYVTYVQRVRTYAKEMDLENAVKRAVDECIREDIIDEKGKGLLQNLNLHYVICTV